jgi:hypothetical protein
MRAYRRTGALGSISETEVCSRVDAVRNPDHAVTGYSVEGIVTLFWSVLRLMK